MDAEKQESIESMRENIIHEVNQIAEKYNVTTGDIMKILSSERKDKDNFHIRFSENELKVVDEKCRKSGLNRSSYCALCFKKAVDERLYQDIDVVQIARRNFGDERRNKRVHVSIKKLGVNAKDVIVFADEIGVEVSALLRYAALNIQF